MDRLWQALFSPRVVWGGLWLGLVVLTIALLILMRTRWGQAQLLRKCIALSVLAHLLFAIYAATVQIVVSGSLGHENVLHISSLETEGESGSKSAQDPEGVDEAPWEEFPTESLSGIALPSPERQDPPPDVQPPEPKLDVGSLPGELLPRDAPKVAKTTPAAPANNQDRPAEEIRPAPPVAIEASTAVRRDVEPLGPRPDSPQRLTPPATDIGSAPLSELHRPAATGVDIPSLLPPLDRPIAPDTDTDETARDAADVSGNTDLVAPLQSSLIPIPKRGPAPLPGPEGLAGGPSGGSPAAAASSEGGKPAETTTESAAASMSGTGEAAAVLRGRQAPNRLQIAQQNGGSAETEAAVEAALAWLAINQEADGRWSPARHGAGRELHVDGQDRRARAKADTGITGLALLAFLGAGQTHKEGQYQQTVRQGLQYLTGRQAANGNLGGEAEVFAFMYCHGMATMALSEAHAMTRDASLLPPLRRAIDYTIAAQNLTTGGWRYRPGDMGDTSQLGWQIMALKSAELSGIATPPRTRELIERFLGTVAAGRRGGLAVYQPGRAATRAMTAEAMVCRQFLSPHRRGPADDEAAAFLAEELPGEGQTNLYYWYYATLALYQVQGLEWEQWNAAVKTRLTTTQRTSGSLAGSWDTDCIWAGYGGRVYTTSLAALSLEVYYRYLPLYIEAAAARERRIK